VEHFLAGEKLDAASLTNRKKRILKDLIDFLHRYPPEVRNTMAKMYLLKKERTHDLGGGEPSLFLKRLQQICNDIRETEKERQNEMNNQQT